jgi:hypothetical protein
VQQTCTAGQDCVVACAESEVAVGAYCPKRVAAVLTSPRIVSCGDGNDAPMVAFCAR